MKMQNILRSFLAMTSILTVGAAAEAVTTYTSLQETPVRDKPSAIGGVVVARLPSGSMIETEKQVGAFTAVSYIMDGKVKSGFIATTYLSGGILPTKSGPIQEMSAVPEDPAAVAIARLQNLQVSASDLASFAKNGGLADRRSKAKAGK